MSADGSPGSNPVLRVCRAELRRVVSLKPAFMVLVGAILIYAAFYPQPYLNEILRDAPIAVVDRDGSAASRELIRRIDATADIAVVLSTPDLPGAERAVYDRRVYGILLIPEGFERDLLHGRAAPIALYADASYFLIYRSVAGGVSGAARAFGAEVETARLVGAGVDPAIAAAAADPLRLVDTPLFNPQGGYATYILPAVFVLILQQTLLIGVGLLGTLPGARDEPAGPAATVAGKLLAYLALEALIIPFNLIVLPYLYGVPRLGDLSTAAAVATPFALSVGALGLIAAEIFRKPLTIQLVFAAVGMPFLFLAGFAWPIEAIPEPIRLVATLLPSTAAIDALVRVDQLGARLSDVQAQTLTLWALAAAYGGLAVLLESRARQARPARGG